MQREKIIGSLNSRSRLHRYKLLKKLRKGMPENPVKTEKATLFLKSTYSFSSFSPSMLAYLGYKNDCGLIGLFDAETIEGTKEFVKGCKLFNLSYVIGTDIRVQPHIADTEFSNCGLLGVGAVYHKSAEKFLKPYREDHREKLAELVRKLNNELKTSNVKLSFSKDVCSLSKAGTGGTVTDRHVWLALAKKFISLYGKGEKLAKKLQSFNLAVTEDEKLFFAEENLFFEYDLARFLKNKYKIGIKADKDPKEIVEFAKQINAISFYELRFSVKGNEKEIVSSVKDYGYGALAFNPKEMDEEEVKTIIKECDNLEIIALPLEVVDFPRKRFESFVSCESQKKVLEKNAWAICGHQILADKGESGFSALGKVDFEKRIEILSGISRPEYYNN